MIEWKHTPELLEFAEEWLRIQQGGDDNYMTAKVKAVIAKAKRRIRCGY